VGFENALPFLNRIRREGFDSARIGAGKGIEVNISENQEGSFIPRDGNNPVLENLSRTRADRNRMDGENPASKEEDCCGDLSLSIHRAARLQAQL
jgi:hypothetical protein